MDNQQDIIDLIKSTPAIQPPDNLTRRLMGRLSDLKPSVLFRIKQALLQPREVDCNLSRVMAGTAKSPAECAFSFFIVGFFYLTLGAFLVIGFKGFMTEAAITQWIKMQPQIVMVMALWLIIQGVALLLDGKIAVKAAEMGILFFIGFAIINGLIMMSDTPLSIVFALAFAGTGLMMGVFLGFTIWKYQKNMQQQKGFSG